MSLPACATLVRADNPGPMTLDGTNTWVLRRPGTAACLVVDPGPDDDAHLARVVTAVAGPDGSGRAVAVVVTHRHLDHTAGAARLAARLGAPARAALPELCSPGAPPLRDGEELAVDGLRVVVVATPGHTSDSVSLSLPDDGVVLTGDTVLGAGSTVLMERDGGSLSDYLASLDVLERLATTPAASPADTGRTDRADPVVGRGAGATDARARVVGLPGHGPVVDDLGARVRAYREHRLTRLAEVRAALDAADRRAATDDATVADVLARVYPDVPDSLRPAATQSVRVQLAHLARTGDAGPADLAARPADDAGDDTDRADRTADRDAPDARG